MQITYDHKAEDLFGIFGLTKDQVKEIDHIVKAETQVAVEACNKEGATEEEKQEFIISKMLERIFAKLNPQQIALLAAQVLDDALRFYAQQAVLKMMTEQLGKEAAQDVPHEEVQTTGEGGKA